MSLATTLLIVLICLTIEAFFSGSEIALVSADRIRLRRLAEEGRRGPGLALLLLKRPQWLFGTTLVGTNISTITASITITLFLADRLDANVEWLAVLCTVPLTLVLAEFIPKSLFQHWADRIAPLVVFPLLALSLLFAPVVGLAVLVSGGVARLVGGRAEKGGPFLSRDELKLLAQQHRSDATLAHESRMIGRMIGFHALTCREVAKPLVQVTVMRRHFDVGQALQVVKQAGFSKYPVCGERVDDVLGIVHSFDLLGQAPDAPLEPLLRPAFFVPQSMRAELLLAEMQRSGRSLAIVVDEYGGADGIVTAEDLLEEIVGEIEDEHDTAHQIWSVQAPGAYLINARAEVDRLNEELGLNLPVGQYQTLGGLLLDRLGRIPRIGEQLVLPGLTLTVRRATSRALQQIQLKLEAAPGPPAE